MFSVIARHGRPVLGALLLGTVYSIASPVFAACDVQGTYSVLECSIEGVHIELTGPSATVTLDDYTLDPTGSGFVRILANESAQNPTDITVNVTGASTIHSPDYDGIDVRTARGDIALTIGSETSINAAQTSVFVESRDPSQTVDDVTTPYDGGNIVIYNYGRIQTGPDGGAMGSHGMPAAPMAAGCKYTTLAR